METPRQVDGHGSVSMGGGEFRYWIVFAVQSIEFPPATFSNKVLCPPFTTANLGIQGILRLYKVKLGSFETRVRKLGRRVVVFWRLSVRLQRGDKNREICIPISIAPRYLVPINNLEDNTPLSLAMSSCALLK